MTLYSGLKQNQKGIRNKKKEREWVKDIMKQVEISNKRGKRLSENFKKCMPKSIIRRFIVKWISARIEGNYKQKITKVQKSVLTA